ncbi:MAG: hypothetical protein MI924_10285 [Chloroflexales bacterium]|nr:hypothetical protein [Chloroflexales bacterium]
MSRRPTSPIRTRNLEQLSGLFLTLGVNVALWFGQPFILAWVTGMFRRLLPFSQIHTVIMLLPWIINGALVLILFWRRPQMGIGYLACFGIAIGTSLILRTLVFGSCLIGLLIGFPLMAIGGEALGGALVLLVSFGLMIAGLIYLIPKGYEALVDWWYRMEDDDTTQSS